MYRTNKCGFICTIFYCLFLVCWREINFVASAKYEELKFWDPNAEATNEIIARRTESHRYRNRIEGQDKTGHYGKDDKSADPVSHIRYYTTKDVRYRTTGAIKEALRANHYRSLNSTEKKKEALRTLTSKRDVFEPNTHGREPDKEHLQDDARWPRVHRHKQKIIKSTRLTPAYLMQKDSETVPPKPTPFASSKGEQSTYLSPYSISRDIQDIISKFPYVNVTKEVIGRTMEYNDILLLKMTELKGDRVFRADDSKYIDEVPEKKIIFIVHGLSVMGMYYLLCMHEKKYFEKLLSYYISHLDKFDIFLIPMANPDGFPASNSIWNKNMSPQSACPGVALDRNFDIAWNMSRDISSCSQMYPGPTPFSEPETRAVRDIFHHYSHKIVGYLHVHAGTFSTATFKGDAVLFPKGYTDIQSDDDKYIDLKGEIDEALKNASFQVISVAVDTLHNWYGKVSGSSVDYASSVYGIPYAMELVMQLYQNSELESKSEMLTDYLALTELWNRIIDVVFNNIWRNTRGDYNNNNNR